MLPRIAIFSNVKIFDITSISTVTVRVRLNELVSLNILHNNNNNI